MRPALAAAASIASMVLAGTAYAHTRSVSYSNWTVLSADSVTVRARVSRLDLTAVLPTGDEPQLREYLTGNLTARGCVPLPNTFAALPAGDGWLARSWRLSCDASPKELRSRLFIEPLPQHVHFMSVFENGETFDAVLAAREQTFVRNRGSSAWHFVQLGGEHILGGWDHLVFLLALVLFGTRLRTVILLVTGFTLGHSIALGLAVVGWAAPAAGPVEFLIAVSIAVVAIENVWLIEERRGYALPVLAVVSLFGLALAVAIPTRVALGASLFVACYWALLARAERPERLRWTFAALFGVVHGFGFAGALTELALPPARLGAALLGFNVGVELGQVAVLALVWPAWRFVVSRGESAHLFAVRWGSAAALGAAMFWMVQRLM